MWDFLVVQWLRVCLPLQGTQAPSLVRQLKIPHATGRLSPRAAMKTHVCSVAQLCPALRDSMDCSPPGSSWLGFSSQEYWSGLPCPPPEDLSDPRIKLLLPTSVGRFFTTSATWEAPIFNQIFKYLFNTAKYLNKQTKNFCCSSSDSNIQLPNGYRGGGHSHGPGLVVLVNSSAMWVWL